MTSSVTHFEIYAEDPAEPFQTFKIRAPRLAEQEEDRERVRELDPSYATRPIKVSRAK